MNKIIFALPLSLALAACGSAGEPPTDLDTAESDGAAAALARNIEANSSISSLARRSSDRRARK